MSPLIGASSDIFGRKSVLLLTMVGVALSYLIWAVSYSFPLFLLARVVCGVSKGNISLSTAIVTDVTKSESRGRAMALVGVAFSLGFIFGPSIGAMFSILGKSGSPVVTDFTSFQYPALFALTLAVVDILLVLFLMKETLPREQRALSLGNGIKGALFLINPFSLFKFSAVNKIDQTDLRSLRRLGMAYFFYLFLFSGLEYSLTFLVHQKFNYTSMQQGKMFLFIGVLMAAVQGGYVRRIPAGKESKAALLGIVAMIPGLVLAGVASGQTVLYVGLALYSFGAGSIVPCMTTLVSEYGEGNEKGKVMGIFRSLGALARAFGPFAASAVYWSCGPFLCYTVGGVLMVLPLLVLQRTEKYKKQ
jgi:MFS family permease